MTRAIRFTLAAAALAGGINLAVAQAAQDQDPHHPGPPTMQTNPPATGKHAPARGPGMMMGGDMSQMMTMMNMMSSMRDDMMPMGMGRGMLRHVEGMIAFNKAELRITDAQLPQWNAFADAMRGAASRMQKAMTDTTPAAGIVPAPQQMERRIAVLSGRLEAMQTVLTAGKSLYAVLSDEQKHTADELVSEHMMAMRGMGRMPDR